MFVQTETTPNPNSLKFLPGKKVSNNGSFEITKKDNISNEYITIINPVNKEDKFKLRFKTIFDKGATKIIPSTSKINKDTIFEIKDGIYDKFTFKNIKENNDRYCYLLNNKINDKKKNLSNINNNNNKLKNIIQETIYKLQRNCL